MRFGSTRDDEAVADHAGQLVAARRLYALLRLLRMIQFGAAEGSVEGAVCGGCRTRRANASMSSAEVFDTAQ